MSRCARAEPRSSSAAASSPTIYARRTLPHSRHRSVAFTGPQPHPKPQQSRGAAVDLMPLNQTGEEEREEGGTGLLAEGDPSA